MIPVAKPYLPDRGKLDKYFDRIYDKCWLTNNGPLVQELTERLKDYLDVEHMLLVSNGTLALQIAYKALNIKGAAITTPFSFAATASSLVWEGITPKFTDIDPETFCINPDLIEKALESDVTAIVPVHVFGNACEIEHIDEIAKKHNLKVIYDAAHTFGIRYKGKNILNFGDASTLSFHATKLFHTIEGGAIIFKKKEILDRAKLLINFGINAPDSIASLGINAKMNEFQAAMGLAVLDSIEYILRKRSEIWHYYNKNLLGYFQFQKWNHNATNNYGYYPIVFKNEEELLKMKEKLNENKINPRRYFFPSLDRVYCNNDQEMKISRNISNRILCLPIYTELTKVELSNICSILKR